MAAQEIGSVWSLSEDRVFSLHCSGLRGESTVSALIIFCEGERVSSCGASRFRCETGTARRDIGTGGIRVFFSRSSAPVIGEPVGLAGSHDVRLRQENASGSEEAMQGSEFVRRRKEGRVGEKVLRKAGSEDGGVEKRRAREEGGVGSKCVLSPTPPSCGLRLERCFVRSGQKFSVVGLLEEAQVAPKSGQFHN